MFIVLLEYTCVLEEVDKYLDAHINYLKEQYAKGNFMASGRKVPRTGGVIFSNLQNKNKLEAVLANDPFNKTGIATYTIVEFIPTMVAEGFEVLQYNNDVTKESPDE